MIISIYIVLFRYCIRHDANDGSRSKNAGGSNRKRFQRKSKKKKVLKNILMIILKELIELIKLFKVYDGF